MGAKTGIGSKFAAKYGVTKLVYVEIFEDPYEAISREKQIKSGPRRRKISLLDREQIQTGVIWPIGSSKGIATPLRGSR